MKNALRVTTFAFAVLLLSSAVHADPQTGASATNAAPATTSGTTIPARHAGPCHDDVQKFCSNVPKGNGKVLDCLKAHVGQLSPRCEAGMKRHASQQSAPKTTPAPSTNGTPAPGK